MIGDINFDVDYNGNVVKAEEATANYYLKIVKDVLNDPAFNSEYDNLVNCYDFDACRVSDEAEHKSFKDLLSSWQSFQSYTINVLVYSAKFKISDQKKKRQRAVLARCFGRRHSTRIKKSRSPAWFIEVFAAEELFYFPYPFQLPKSFLVSKQKNDLRLKVRLLKSIAVKEKEKIFDSEEFFNPINVRNDDLIKIKENIIQLLKELSKEEIIHNRLEIVLKSGKIKNGLIKKLTASDITRRIKYLKFIENIKN